MNLTAIILLTTCLAASATGVTQTVTLDLTNAPIQKVFREVIRQTGTSIVYNEALFKDAPPVTIKVKDATIAEVMDKCLQGQPFTFNIDNNAIVIKEKNVTLMLSRDDGPPLPPGEIHGRITNKDGVPLPGANIIINRTKRGTQTDARGEFILEDVKPDDVLLVSYIGYKTQIVKVSEDQEFPLVLEVATNELDKVVIQAYGTTTQRLATGNIATVSAAEIERQPVMNVLTALEGKVPGLVIQIPQGQGAYASGPLKVEIRGRSAIDPNRASEPLYIVDGVPLTVLGLSGFYSQGSFLQSGINGPARGQSPLFSINPNDIESISVLKDADATAIYGSRGANGVIIITTKTGKQGKSKFNINAYTGVDYVTRHYSMLNTQQYLAMRHEAFNNDNITLNTGNAFDLLTWDTTSYTDWQKYLWGAMGKSNDIQGSFTGGDKQTTFRIGGAYHRETDITTVNGANQRGSVQFNLAHKSLNQRLGFSFTSTYSYTNVNIINVPAGVTQPPNSPGSFDAEGNLNYAGWAPADYLFPFGSLLAPYEAKTGFLNSSLSMDYEIFKGLIFTTKLGYSSTHNSQISINSIASQNPAYHPTGSAQFGNNNNTNIILEPQLEYKTLISKGQLDAFIGASYQGVYQDGSELFGSGYLNDNLLRSVSNAPTKSASDGSGTYKYEGIFARINYNLNSKYILNLSGRRDGSSRFSPGRQFGNFGAIGGAWIFSEENWVKQNISFLSFGKLRGSYGLTGSDNIGDYGYLSQWSSVQVSYQQRVPAYIPLGHYNEDLQWQVDKKLEAALDLGFIKDRITLEVAWYRNRCGNQLVDIPLPNQTGFSFVQSNLPAVIQNTGWESTLKAKVADSKDFAWSFNFNIGINRNKLIAYPNLAQSPYASAFIIGQSLNIKKLLHYTGLDPATGMYTFMDRNHDGKINTNQSDTANDLYARDLSIKYDGGFGTDIRYKNWQIDLFFRFRRQEIPGNIQSIGIPGGQNNFPTEILNRWQKVGDKAQFARYTTQPQQSDYNFYGRSDGVYSNGSFIRLQNLSISYDFSSILMKRVGFQSCKIYARGENLFLITKYPGLDPDTPAFGSLPPVKTIIGGLQFTF